MIKEKKEKFKTKQVQIRLEKWLLLALDEIANNSGQYRTTLIKKALTDFYGLKRPRESVYKKDKK